MQAFFDPSMKPALVVPDTLRTSWKPVEAALPSTRATAKGGYIHTRDVMRHGICIMARNNLTHAGTQAQR
jgi:hypothetical protein